MKLIGSDASPYVRRIRILLDKLDLACEYQKVEVFSKSGQDEIFKYTKTRKVPILIDKETVIWDSLLITKYLLQKANQDSISLDLEKEIILINEANDSALNLFQVQFFNLDKENTNTFSIIQYKRIKGILKHFNQYYLDNQVTFDVKDIFIYCLLDWLKFREIFDWTEFEGLKVIYNELAAKDIIKQTSP